MQKRLQNAQNAEKGLAIESLLVGKHSVLAKMPGQSAPFQVEALKMQRIQCLHSSVSTARFVVVPLVSTNPMLSHKRIHCWLLVVLGDSSGWNYSRQKLSYKGSSSVALEKFDATFNKTCAIFSILVKEHVCDVLYVRPSAPTVNAKHVPDPSAPQSRGPRSLRVLCRALSSTKVKGDACPFGPAD